MGMGTIVEGPMVAGTILEETMEVENLVETMETEKIATGTMAANVGDVYRMCL